MDRAAVVNYCVGLLSLLLLQGVLHVKGRGILSPESRFFNPDTDAHSKILALLMHKSLVSAEKEDHLGSVLANKLAELEELRSLKDDLEQDKEIIVNLAQGRPMTRKRGEPCFWKYCV